MIEIRKSHSISFSKTKRQHHIKKQKNAKRSTKFIHPKLASKLEIHNENLKMYVRRMAQISNFAYCLPYNDIGKVLEDRNIVADIFTKDLETTGAVVYFRGPIFTKEQWRARSIYLKSLEWDDNTLVDKIWLQNVRKMMPSLVSKLENAAQENKSIKRFKIHFVGHGIGGAALHLEHLVVKQIARGIRNLNPWRYVIVTFGAPRIGNLSFAKLVKLTFFSAHIHRVTNANDWLSREMMPKGLFLHFEPEYWQEKVNQCECQDYYFRFSKCIGRIQGEIDESQECNLGTVDFERETSQDLNMGPFMGVIFGKCRN
ncbi:hypothetical protein G9A89_023035 [Geosiphon pyriformis]|nr:hypothetical protein G9A89_023035 [Geosiphon pyriformis]